MKHKKLVITGGAGFIGSNISDELSKDNEIIIIDNLSTGKLANINSIISRNNINFINGDILDLGLLEKTFKDVDIIFHEAAIANVSRSINDPILTNETNIKGTLNVLIAARNNKVEKVVFASSSAIYGDTSILPISENILPNPQSPYSITKLTGEYYCRLFTELYGLPSVCLRYFNVFGPRQNPNLEYSAVIPSFISNILNGSQPVIYGDGTQTRDFVFVRDVVQANIIFAESKATGIVNIGSGISTTINELAQKIIDIFGSNLCPIYKEPRISEVRQSVADLTLANLMGYRPKYNLENGLRETIKSIKISNQSY